MKRHKIVRSLQILLLAVLSVILFASAASAEPTAGWTVSGKKTYYYLESETGLLKAVGLREIGADYFYFNEKGLLQTGWVETADGLRYFVPTGEVGALGRMLTGLRKIAGKTYYFDAHGVMARGYLELKKGAYFFRRKGAIGVIGSAYQNKWVKVSGQKRYFGSNGRMVRQAWVGDYYVDEDGIRLVDTITPDGYLVGSDGRRVSNTKVNGWVKINKKYYYYDLKKQTLLKDKWKTINGIKYRLGPDGARLKGWQTIGSYKYYFNSKGEMKTGKVTIKSKDYYFNAKGRLVISSTVDGYTTDANGVIIKESNSSGDTAKILIVAGHGQGDAGATSVLGQEYLKTREFARLIYNKLVSNGKVSVDYYMNGSTSYDMYQRNVAALGSLAPSATGVKGNGAKKTALKTALKNTSTVPNLWEYDYVLEVHFNATAESSKDISGNGVAKGFGIYINQYKSSKHRQIDTKIVSNMRSIGSAIWAGGVVTSAGLLNARVCNELDVNYSLIETAFIDDRDDMNFYNAKKNSMATAVATAIESYFG